jgi:hypothetical protein
VYTALYAGDELPGRFAASRVLPMDPLSRNKGQELGMGKVIPQIANWPVPAGFPLLDSPLFRRQQPNIR